MASRDHLESILWPRYKADSVALCHAIWGVANPKQAQVKSPEWFNEIVEAQAKSMLMTVFSTSQAWVVFPEPVPGFTAVIFKKPQEAAIAATQQKLTLRHHSLDQFSELAQLVERAMVNLLKSRTASPDGDVVRLENEDAHIFVFPREKLAEYLKKLGFGEEQIPHLLTVDDIEGEF